MERHSRPSFPGMPKERVRVEIPGVAGTISADIASRRDSAWTLTQHLPLLRIGQEVTAEGGARMQISRVALDLEQGVPKLVIELAKAADIIDEDFEPIATNARLREPTVSYTRSQEPTNDARDTKASGFFEKPATPSARERRETMAYLQIAPSESSLYADTEAVNTDLLNAELERIATGDTLVMPALTATAKSSSTSDHHGLWSQLKKAFAR